MKVLGYFSLMKLEEMPFFLKVKESESESEVVSDSLQPHGL